MMETVGVEMISFDVNRKLKEPGSVAVKEEFKFIIEPTISFTPALSIHSRRGHCNRVWCVSTVPIRSLV
jgi:hypothetical protein